MTAKRAGGVGALVLTLAAGGCFGSPGPATAPPPAPSAAVVRHATYPVGLRVLPLRRGAGRPLTTLVFYPAALMPDHAVTPPARFPASPTSRPPLGSPAALGRQAEPPPGHQTAPSEPATAPGRQAAPPPGHQTAPSEPATAPGRQAAPPPGHPTAPPPGPATAGGQRAASPAGVELSRLRRQVFLVQGAAGRAPAEAHGAAGGASVGRMPIAAGGDRIGLRVTRQVRRHGTLAYGVLGARPADGRFPLVLFSHGLSGSPEWCAAALAAWASAGFVVAAPTFPHTSEFARDYRRGDIVNQPDDVRYVLDRLRRLSGTPGDPLHGRIDGDRVAAVGHSAGGYTTTGLFTAGHDPRLRAGVVMAGWHAPGAFAGPSATMLFLQGAADPVVPAAVSRAAFDQVPWPKSYLLMPRVSHADYLRRDQLGYARVTATVAAFLRWTLAGDQAARLRLPPVLPSAVDAVG